SRTMAPGEAAARWRPRHGDEPTSQHCRAWLYASGTEVGPERVKGRVKCYFVLSQYTPMAPRQVREPFHCDGWVYEEKVDGWRILAYKDGGRVRLISRNGRDHTRRFRDIAAVAKLSARTLVLDGEVAIFDEKFRSRFDWL